MMQLSPSRTRVLLFAVPAVILAMVLAAIAFRPRPTTSAATPSLPASVASSQAAGASGGPGAASPRPPATQPIPTRAPTSCVLPDSLPTPPEPVAAPMVEAGDVAMVFASHLYDRSPGGSPVVLDRLDFTWAMGLWFVPAGSEDARLLAAPPGGMVLPLALSPSGDVAAVWWLPERRVPGRPSCESGIYLVSTATGASQLAVRGDWTEERSPDEVVNDVVGIGWTDPRTTDSDPRSYRLPEVAFSADETHLALVEGLRISIFLRGETRARWQHVGACSSWAWSPVRATFVAGCEAMTSAWLVRAVGGEGAMSVALPWTRTAGIRSRWGDSSSDAIGLTRDDHIRVASFYGSATGCEADPCTIPPPAYAIATIDPVTDEATIRFDTVNFLAGYEERPPTGFSADASWVYTERYARGARTIVARNGEISTAPRLGLHVGASADGSLLFGIPMTEDPAEVVVRSLDASGAMVDVAVIRLADGATGSDSFIRAYGLSVALPRS